MGSLIDMVVSKGSGMSVEVAKGLLTNARDKLMSDHKKSVIILIKVVELDKLKEAAQEMGWTMLPTVMRPEDFLFCTEVRSPEGCRVQLIHEFK